jgi:hypothetical protein
VCFGAPGGGYVSRGIATSGTKSRSWDPREELMDWARERVTRPETRQDGGS